jgi:hypothetical protein
MNSIKRAIFIAILIFNSQVFIGETLFDGFSKEGLSGLTRAIDDRDAQLDTLGDPHGGLPDDVTSLVKYCA